MIDFVKNRKYAYIFSGIIISVSLIALIVFGLKTGMDFKGGSVLELKLNGHQIDQSFIEGVYKQFDYQNVVLTLNGDDDLTIKSVDVIEENHQQIISKIKEKYNNVEELRFESFGPVIGKELENKSMDKLEEQGKVIIHINKMLNSAIAILLLLGVIILVLIFSMFQ